MECGQGPGQTGFAAFGVDPRGALPPGPPGIFEEQ